MRKVQVDQQINVSPKKIIDAFTDHELLNGWWGVENSLVQLKPGGLYTLVWKISARGFGFVSTGIIEEYISGSRLEIGNFIYVNPERNILGPMKLSLEVEKNDAGGILKLCQDGYQQGGDWDWYYEAVKEAWPQAIGQLKQFLEAH